MTQFPAEKIGETMAFAEVGLETIEKARTELETAVGLEETESLVFQFSTALDELTGMIREFGMTDASEAKARKTAQKIRDMRDRYLSSEDDWKNPVEIAEWCGFFFGGAAVHFAVSEGILDSLAKDELQRTTKAAQANMIELLMHLVGYLRDLGLEKTSNREK